MRRDICGVPMVINTDTSGASPISFIIDFQVFFLFALVFLIIGFLFGVIYSELGWALFV